MTNLHQPTSAAERRSPAQRRGTARWFIWVLACLMALLLGVVHGSTAIPLGAVLTALIHPGRGIVAVIVWQIRLPRIVAAALVGGALASAGATMQALLQNPLADPYIVGASAGAGLGAVVVETVLPGTLLMAPAAFFGALFSVFLSWTLSRGRGRSAMLTLLLAGYALSVMFSAISTFLMFAREQSLSAIFAWEMGGIHGMTWTTVAVTGVIMLLGLTLLVPERRHMNALLMGEDVALSVGVPVRRSQGILLLSASLLTAAAVYAGGLIGFVGLVVPHVMRRLVGAEHERLLPMTFLAGATFLMLADTLAENLPPLGLLPVGVITAFLGGPYFLYLLADRGRGNRPN